MIFIFILSIVSFCVKSIITAIKFYYICNCCPKKPSNTEASRKPSLGHRFTLRLKGGPCLAQVRTQGLANLSTHDAMISIKISLIILPSPKLLTWNGKKNGMYYFDAFWQNYFNSSWAAPYFNAIWNIFIQTVLIKSKI
jgi:hypothetical protein